MSNNFFFLFAVESVSKIGLLTTEKVGQKMCQLHSGLSI